MHKRLDDNSSADAAFYLRSAAIFGALLQYDFLAKDLTDTAVSCTTLLIALIAGAALSTLRVKAVHAISSLLLAPAAARLFIALPRWFSDNLALNTALDSFLLDYDRNLTVLVLPFYYAAITAFFARGSRRSLRSCALLDCALVALTFSIARSAEMRVYHLPVILLSVFGLLLALELAVIILSIPKNAFITKRETGISFALLACFLIAGGILFFFEAQKENYNQQSADGGSGAVPAGNGLIKPGLFSFDMTPSLNLNSEVSMGDELVLIARKEKKDDHILMRRFTLSAYHSVKTGSVDAGFTRHEVIDEKTQRREVPAGRLELSVPEYRSRQRLKQEYYIKNIDGASLLGMNEPESITPFENYNESSFKSVYEVESLVSTATPYQLFESAVAYRSDPYFGMSQDEFLWYTAFANAKGGITLTEQGVKDLAEYLTEKYDDNFSKTVALLEYFTQGDFRYSLKPGIAADGDQLNHFLFETKRGYCSYFAFAFASMLRSLGIPSRVAVGFYLDPATESFGFYPIRSGNAHAWVEVFFPEYGWIEFDPTTDVYAEDELEPSMESGDNFELLMKEILENRSKLKQKPAMTQDDDGQPFFEKLREAARKARPVLLPLLLGSFALAVLIMRGRYFWLSLLSKEPRRKTRLLWRHILVRLRRRGMKASPTLSEAQWIETLPCAETLVPLYEAVCRARYAPSWTAEDAARFFDKYKTLRAFLKTAGKGKAKTVLLVFLFAALTLQQSARAQELFEDANALSDAAFKAEQSEYWERAIALYNEGKSLYPDDWRFPMSLGDLYFRKALYNLAKDEYHAAYILVPDYLDLIYKLAIVSGSLNENGNAAGYFEQYLEYAPDDIDVISELGWMYFKLHRLEEGEALLLSAIETHGVTRRLAMTLATIYSDMLNYPESSRWYTTAINLSQSNLYRSHDFSATAYYNYAILESRFYNYETAFELAQNSLNMADRDTGHMMRGELYLRRFDVGRAYTEYARAFEMDKQSPLPKVSLAQIHLITGRLEEARRYAEDCLKATNHAWMFRFGIDPGQYARDLHEILYKSYEGLVHQERFISYGTFKQRWKNFVKTLRFRAASRAHKKLYEKYSLRTARSYSLPDMPEQGGQYLESLLQYTNAFGDFPSRARYYLRLAEAYETALIPRSQGEYLYMRGKLERNVALLEDALFNLDSVWERDKIADVYTELYHIAKQRGLRVKARETAESLYLLNPGALARNGIRLPVEISITGGSAREQRTLRGTVLKSGFEAVNPAGGPGRLELRLAHTGDLVQIVLRDRISGAVLQRRTVPAPDHTALQRAAFAAHLRETVFTFR